MWINTTRRLSDALEQIKLTPGILILGAAGVLIGLLMLFSGSVLMGLIIAGGAGIWGAVPMTPHPQISQADAEQMVKYVLLLKK